MTADATAIFNAKLIDAWPPERWRDVTVLLAVSGGADSVALARAIAAVRQPGDGRVIVGHFNHRLRGAASDADETFVRTLADQLSCQCLVGHADNDLNATGGDGLEAAARDARYAFLATAASEWGARYLVTAHTADDQVETVLFNILRGTGLAGLAGIPRLRTLTPATTIVRPLLGFTRSEITAYLTAKNQDFRHDPSNDTADYTRNRIRLELLPQLENDYNPRVRDALLRLAQAANQADDFVEQQAESALYSAARKIPNGFELDLKRLAHLHPTVIRHALTLLWREAHWPLQDMSFDKWESLVALIRQSDSAPGTQQHDLPGFVRATQTGSTLKIELTTR